LLNNEGELDPDIGRLLSFGGRIGNSADSTPLESVAALYGHTALGGALRLTLLSQRLRPAIDPRTGERPPPDFGDARVLVEDTCMDSGVAALTTELLSQRAASLPADFRVRESSTVAAWEGTTATSNETIATYSDPSLQPISPSLHFCFNEESLRRNVATTLPRVARRLLDASPSRIVVVGHGDRAGICRFNDELALHRAQAVRNALIEAGITARKIVAVSLGERRPLDFASTEQADAVNRRVEILVEGAENSVQPDSIERIMPQCPQRPIAHD
jgi:outer membrane protein OmpA-like peptidoglycan-associated protein